MSRTLVLKLMGVAIASSTLLGQVVGCQQSSDSVAPKSLDGTPVSDADVNTVVPPGVESPVPYSTYAPDDPEHGIYRTSSPEFVADEIIKDFETSSWSKAPAHVIRAIDITRSDAKSLGVQESLIEDSGEPDVAALISGSFQINLPGFRDNIGNLKTYKYVVILVDRTTGVNYNISAFNDIGEAPAAFRDAR